MVNYFPGIRAPADVLDAATAPQRFTLRRLSIRLRVTSGAPLQHITHNLQPTTLHSPPQIPKHFPTFIHVCKFSQNTTRPFKKPFND